MLMILNSSMKNIILISFVCLICQNYALVCPEYLPKSSNENFFLQTCQTNCSFSNSTELFSACMGVYINRTGTIFIKQLSTISSDNECLKWQECLLERDSINSQIFSCCCSTDNCTLNWQILSSLQSTTIYSISTRKYSFQQTSTFLSWKWFFILFLCLMIIILLILTIYLSLTLKLKTQLKDKKQILIKSSSISILNEQLFVCRQQISIGKYSKIYRTLMNNEFVILKIYEQKNHCIWENEMSILKSIQHQSIIKLLSDGEYHSDYYLVFSYYQNGTLQTYLRTSNRTLSISQCLNYFRSLASAIAYLHLGQNSTHMTIIHRDIKSSNILIDINQSNIYLADFDLALCLPAILTDKHFVQIGTTRYMAPELLEGVIAHTREALCSVDVYALALVMWEILMQCEVYSNTIYQLPYEEFLINESERSTFAGQFYDIVVVRRCRPSLNRDLKNPEYQSIIDQFNFLIESCWTSDADIRMNAQTLLFKLNQIIF